MQAVILAGGLGSRLSEETFLRPKPMVEIGGKPILWHIMKIYSHYGINDFIVCCGYKGYMIKEYFSNYFMHTSDVTFDLRNNKMKIHRERSEPWKVTLVDTGEDTMTGGRLLRVKRYLKGDKNFCFTYGDGVADINIRSLIDFHINHGKLATVTVTVPPGRFGVVSVEDRQVNEFNEKPRCEGTLVNGGFFVLNQKVFKYLKNDNCVWEQGPLEALASEKELMAFRHHGFWKPMDTLRDKNSLEQIWNSSFIPWKVWN